MKLGARLSLLTALIMGVTLGLSTWILASLRRAELERELHARAHERALSLLRSIAPIPHAPSEDWLASASNTLAAELAPFAIEHYALAPGRPSDRGWAQLFEAAAIEGRPAGRLFAPDGRPPFYAMAVPLHENRDGERGRLVATIGLRGDARHIDATVARTLRNALPLVALVIAVLGLLVYLILHKSVVVPLRRLVDAIDAVAAGDLSRAVLPERNDEIGLLTGRFNRMTEALREAHAKERSAVESRQALEARLRHSEKLATIGQLAAQIAHEVGTPLNVIGGRARTLQKRASDPAEVRKNVEIINTQVERITNIIRQVLTFSRKSRPTLTQVDVAQVARESLSFLTETLVRQHVETQLDIPPGLPPVPGDPGEIQQVCLNLLHNALFAMPSGGVLSLRLACVTQRKGRLDHATPTNYLVLEVGDTGPGVPPEDRERIFEPFFTTKDSGQGTGLGLSVAKGIVTDHDGWLEVDSNRAGGALFRAYLPMQAEAPADLSITRP